jgi:hypothetical protein
LTPGVDLVLQGHDHHAEHVITPEGYNEVITGNGGDGLTPLFPPVPGSDFRDNSEYGAVRLTITPETLTVDYVNIPGTVVYSFTMKKDPFTKKAYIVSHTDWTDPNPLPPGDTQGGDKTVSMAFGEDNEYKNGLDWITYESGPAHEINIDGRTALQIDRSAFGTGNNLYMQINDERIFGGPYHAKASIEYQSPVAGSFVLQYESAATGSTYQSTAKVTISDDQVNKWQTVTLDMPSARFTNRQNGHSDMRIVAANKLPLIVSSIKIDATPEAVPVTLWAVRIQNIDPMIAGKTSQAVVKGTYSDFSTAPLSSGLTFTSSDNMVASVDQASGLITANHPGDTVITAAYGGLQDQYHLVVKDSLPPITTLSKDGTLLSDGSYLHEATVQLSATDDYSGVDKIEYSLDQGKTWSPYTNPFVLNQDGNNVIRFRSSDKAGNIESVQTQTIKVTSATIANLIALVKSKTFGEKEIQKSILNQIDNAQKNFQKAAEFLDKNNADQAAHFETKGYDSLQELNKNIEKYSDKALDPAIKTELQTFIQYMISHKT